MKKSLIMLLVFLLMAFALVACNTTETPSGDELGENENAGSDVKEIEKTEIIDGYLWVTYTDGTSVKVGKTSGGSEGLAFYPIDDGKYAVEVGDAKYLSKIVIPATYKGGAVTEILPEAFQEAKNLVSITIPSSVTSISDDAFSGCNKLESIVVEEGNTVYHSAGNCLIETESKTLLLGSNNSVIPNDKSVKIIADYAFFSRTGLTSITIPDGVTSIGLSAFYGCDGLTSITIPDSVTSIGRSAFYGCDGLTSITIPGSVTSIGRHAFYLCTGLKSITIENGVKSIGESAFASCEGIQSITIPDSVTHIGQAAFAYCKNLTSLIFEDTSTWYRATSASDWVNMTNGTSVSLTDPSKNVEYFKSTYSYYWYKE